MIDTVGSRFLSFVRAFVREVSEKDIPFIAASLAYYALISIIPLMLLLLVAASSFGGPGLAAQIVDRISSFLSPTGQALLKRILSNRKGADSATVGGGLTLLWSALRLFRGLDVAFSRAYGLESGSIVKQFKHGIITFVTVSAGIITTVGIGAIATLIPYNTDIISISVIEAVATLVTLFTLVLTLFPMYYVLPGGAVTGAEALPGAIFAAVGWTTLQVVFRFYVRYAAEYRAYGIIGSVLLLAIFFYFAGFILLLGAIINVLLASRTVNVDSAHSWEPDWKM